MKVFLFAMIVLLVWSEEDLAEWYYKTVGEPEAVCTTDSDCQKFCPPPSDDPDCDGGP